MTHVRRTNDAAATVQFGWQHHLALAQLHRWYQFYELTDPILAHQLDLLSPQVRVKSGLGEVQGHAAYGERVSKLPKTWSNAHFVKASELEVEADGSLVLNAQVTYLNQGMLPDGAVRTAELSYLTRLRADRGNVLPKFESLEITQHSEGVVAAFRPAYAENRLLSLAHAWLAIIDCPARAAALAGELLDTNFRLALGGLPVSTLEQLESWIDARGTQATVVRQVSEIACAEPKPDRYELRMRIDTLDGLVDDSAAISSEAHRWTVRDDPTARFARIQAIELQAPPAPSYGKP